MAAKRGRPSKYTAIYALTDEFGRVRYIGKSNNPSKRFQSHLYAKRTPVALWVRSMRARGLRPSVVILEWVEDWDAAERRCIERYRNSGARLLNVSAGGLDMTHVTEARGRFPAYAWVMRFCGRVGNKDLAALIKRKASEARQAGGMSEFDAFLRETVLLATPLARVA